MCANGHLSLILSASPDGSATEIRLEGEVDLASATLLRDAIDQAIRAERPRIVVDAAGLTYLDSSGINCLLHGATAARAAGSQLGVRNAGVMVRRVLAITGVDDLLLEDGAAESPGRCA